MLAQIVIQKKLQCSYTSLTKQIAGFFTIHMHIFGIYPLIFEGTVLGESSYLYSKEGGK